MLATFFGLLSIYWLARFIFCRRSFVQPVLAFLSLILFLMLPKQFAPIPCFTLAVLLAISLFQHIRNKNGPIQLIALAGWGSLYALGGIIAIFVTAFHYQDQRVIGHVVLKGQDEQRWMTWKNPSQASSESAWMPSYEVEILDTKGKKIFSDYLIGDYVAIRAQVIMIDWPYQLLGFSHLSRLEMVHNGYSTAQRHHFYPHVAYALPFSMNFFEKIWNKLFMGDWHIPGIRSATLESSYFPLRGAKLNAQAQHYELVVGETGLSARSTQ